MFDEYEYESKDQENFEKFMMRYKPEIRNFDKVGEHTYSDPLISIAYDCYLEGVRKNQEKIKVYELHVGTIKGIHENELNEKSESSYILGNLDGFFECLESDLAEIK